MIGSETDDALELESATNNVSVTEIVTAGKFEEGSDSITEINSATIMFQKLIMSQRMIQ